MIVFWAITGACLWLIGIGWLLMRAMDASDDGSRLPAALYGIAAIVLSAGVPAIAFSMGERTIDPHANVLCLSAHEEWSTRHRPMMLVGKIIVPPSTYRVKTWVCEAWEAQ